MTQPRSQANARSVVARTALAPLTSSATAIALAGAVLAAPAAAWQGQPVTADDRDVGLAVRELVEGSATGPGGVPLVTVTGKPGALYDLFGGVSSFALPGTLDTATLASGVFGPISAAPTFLTGLFVPTAGTYGVIPPSGTQDLNLAFPVPPGFAGLHLDVQVLHLDTAPPFQLTASNGQVREFLAAPPTGAAWSRGNTYPGSNVHDWNDIEQGDVDGDGDLDTIGVRNNATELWLTTGGVHVGFGSLGAGGTSGELADLDNDGFLDLVVVSGGLGYVRTWLNLGLSASGTWNGFAQSPFNQVTYTGLCFAADVEVADVNGDGLRDLVLACGNDPLTGQQNRLFLSRSQPGTLKFDDATLTNLPNVIDDSEDCEFLDFDLDGDHDVVIANVDGDASIFGTGVDYLLVNQGGIQGGARGVFRAVLIDPSINFRDESLDVAVGDIDGDGKPDLYFSNWQETQPSGVGLGTPARDRLYINRTVGATPSFLDLSNQLPDAAGQRTFGTDAEIFDVDFDGDLDIVSALGTLSGISILAVPAIPDVSTGVQWLENLGTFAAFPRTSILAGLPYDFRDIEHGDWRELPLGAPLVPFGTYFERDMGCATLGAGAQLTTLDHL